MDVTPTEDSIGLIGKREYCGTLNISPEIRKGEKHQTLRFSSCHVKYVLRYEECEQVSSCTTTYAHERYYNYLSQKLGALCLPAGQQMAFS